MKIRGFRIEPGEVETALAEYPGVTEVLVLPREIAGIKSLVAYVVADGAAGERPDPLALRAFLDGRLPEYMHPAAFVPLDRFPLTPNGKVDRRALPEPTAEHRAGAARYEEPADGLERQLAEVWAEVLELPRVGAEDDFLALGGHSLLATRIAARLRSALGLEVPFRALLEARTIRRLAQRIEQRRRCLDRPAARRRRPRPFRGRRDAGDADGAVLPASAAQRRLWLVHEAEPDLCAYNIPFAYALDGPLDADALEAALVAVAGRHESLRTTFKAEAGAPVQVIRPAAWAAGVLRLDRVDLSGLDSAAAEAETARLWVEEERRPFDLEVGPLVRTRLLRLPPAGADRAPRHVWLLTVHHLVFDGWSVAVLLDELGAEYRARLAGRASGVPAPRLQYADFTAWEDGRLQGPELDEHLRYWRETLGESPVPVRVPSDRPRQLRRSFRGSTVAVDLPREAVGRLVAVAAERGATTFMALVAVWQVVLHRISRQDDVLVAAALAGRQRRESEPLIGFFANYLLLRSDLEDDPSFEELLERVRRATAEGMEHQVPFDLIVRALQTERGGAGLDAVTFAMDTTRSADPELAPGLALTPLEHRPETAKCELSLLMDRRADRARLEYNADLFDRETARVWLEAFAAAVAGAAADPRRSVSEIPLIPPVSQDALSSQAPEPVAGAGLPRPLAAGWWGHGRTARRDAGLSAVFEAVVAERGTATAVVAGDGVLSYLDLDRRANRIAHALLRTGIGRGDRVALAFERSAESIAATLGVVKAGAAYVPLDPRYPAERVASMVEDADVTAVIGASSLVDGFGAAVARLPALLLDRPSGREALADASDRPPAVATCGDDLAYVMFTSGSTGRPKGVAVTHRGVVRLVRETDYARFGPDDTFLHLASVSFDAATFEIWGPLLNGGRLVVAPPGPLTVEEIGRSIADGGVDTILLTTGLFHQVVEEDLRALAPIERLFTGGDVLSPPPVRRVVQGLAVNDPVQRLRSDRERHLHHGPRHGWAPGRRRGARAGPHRPADRRHERLRGRSGAPAGAGDGARGAGHRRRRPGLGLLQPPRAHRRALRARSVRPPAGRKPGRSPLPHRRPGSLAPRREPRFPRAHRHPGQAARLPDRARRGRGGAGGPSGGRRGGGGRGPGGGPEGARGLPRRRWRRGADAGRAPAPRDRTPGGVHGAVGVRRPGAAAADRQRQGRPQAPTATVGERPGGGRRLRRAGDRDRAAPGGAVGGDPGRRAGRGGGRLLPPRRPLPAGNQAGRPASGRGRHRDLHEPPVRGADLAPVRRGRRRRRSGRTAGWRRAARGLRERRGGDRAASAAAAYTERSMKRIVSRFPVVIAPFM